MNLDKKILKISREMEDVKDEIENDYEILNNAPFGYTSAFHTDYIDSMYDSINEYYSLVDARDKLKDLKYKVK